MTSLCDGSRLSKDDIRIEAYGTLDELNANIGLLISLLQADTLKEGDTFVSLIDFLVEIQEDLFVIGGHLACEEIKEEVKSVFNPEIKGIKKALSAINYEIKSVPISVEKAVEGKWNTEKEKRELMNQETHLRIQEFIARHQYMQYRESLSIKSLEEKIRIVIDRVLDTYMTNTYLNNPKYATRDGNYILPDINEEVRKSDLEKIYRIFRNIASEDFIDDLAPIYKISTVEGEEFFISTYIAPVYNAAIDGMKKTYMEANENNRQMEEMEKKRLEASLAEPAIVKQQRNVNIRKEIDN